MNATTTTKPTMIEESRGTDPTQWLDLYGDFLFNFAMGQLRDATEAEDLVQETFLAGLKARYRFAGQCSERTWLVSILRHKICDHLRTKCRQPRLADLRRDSESEADEIDESLV